MKVKVCGLTQKAQVEALEKMGVHYAGFIFYPQSPRYVLRHLALSEIRLIDGNIKKVGVFVNEPLPSLQQIMVAAGLGVVQLHGDESVDYCKQVIGKASVVKAFQVKSRAEMLEKIDQYKDVVDCFLFDTPSVQYGGTGEKFDWNAIADIEVGKPFLLSGGISSEDIARIDNFHSFPIARDLLAIDVNSRFEVSPGIKDLVMVEEFLKQLKKLNYAE